MKTQLHSPFNLDQPFAALIFDCDGTLVDTAPLHFRAVNEALAALGHHMEPAWYYDRAGLTPAALFADFERLRNITLDVPELSRRYGPIFTAHLDTLEEITVVAEVARRYHGQVPMAVGSNGHLPNVTATLAATHLLPLFDHIVTAEQVTHGKPAPDVFLEAARRMNVSPAACIVFEDTDEGLEAAHAADMRAFDIRPHFRRPVY